MPRISDPMWRRLVCIAMCGMVLSGSNGVRAGWNPLAEAKKAAQQASSQAAKVAHTAANPARSAGKSLSSGGKKIRSGASSATKKVGTAVTSSKKRLGNAASSSQKKAGSAVANTGKVVKSGAASMPHPMATQAGRARAAIRTRSLSPAKNPVFEPIRSSVSKAPHVGTVIRKAPVRPQTLKQSTLSVRNPLSQMQRMHRLPSSLPMLSTKLPAKSVDRLKPVVPTRITLPTTPLQTTPRYPTILRDIDRERKPAEKVAGKVVMGVLTAIASSGSHGDSTSMGGEFPSESEPKTADDGSKGDFRSNSGQPPKSNDAGDDKDDDDTADEPVEVSGAALNGTRQPE